MLAVLQILPQILQYLKKNFMAENDALQVNKQNMKGTHILKNDYFRDFPQFMGSLISSLQKLRHNLQM